MAQKPEYSFLKKDRRNRIANCGECGGGPPTDKTVLQGMNVTYCTKCMEVVEWTRSNNTIVKVPVVTIVEEENFVDKMQSRVIEVKYEEVIAVDRKFDFKDLENGIRD